MSRWRELLEDVLPRPNKAQPEAPPFSDVESRARARSFGAPASQASQASQRATLVGVGASLLALGIASGLVASSVSAAKRRIAQPGLAGEPAVARAADAEVGYCTPEFKQVLERVLHSCGLSSQTERRGCKPSDIKTFAAIDDADFNALFHPLKERGGVLMFDVGSDELDETGQKLLEDRWFERRGARYFFVVARASKTGTPARNRALSHRRANSVMYHLQQVSDESPEELNRKVGLLWLGNEYAQLSEAYCAWPRSRVDAPCGEEPINRSAFVSWVDCRL